MIASSGAGKSHFIECLAARMANRDLRPITYNMAAMERSEDLIQPLDTARNLKVEDKLPLLFLDEFDASPKNYAVLLPLLWDGEIHLGHRDLKLGKLIIVLAGSKPNMPDMIEAARSMQTKEK
jgi:MoxR-like ATPase